jgi:hypothetical protein
MTQLPSEHPSAVTAPVELTESARHRLLADPERRVVLERLSGLTAPVELAELAEAVSTCDGDGGVAVPEPTTRVKARLHHTHLPKLAEAGVLDYDSDANRVESWHSPGRLL